jgi:CheY-like chemotaxis protein
MSRTRATILCIDSQWNELVERRRLLEQGGYEVLDSSDWEEGLKLFARFAVHAVVLDYQTPGMNGAVVAAMMKRMKPQIPVLLISAYGPLPTKKLRSIDTFLYKSEIPIMLLPTVRDLLDGRPKPFFYRWLDHWKSRNQVIPQ